ncbi:GNAT family protein [Arthrobacter tecti]
MSDLVPPWPAEDPSFGQVFLRRFIPDDVTAVIDLSQDPYVPHIGTLPARATGAQAQAWLKRQEQRYTDRTTFSFAMANRTTGACLGFIGLTIRELASGRAQAGYAVAPSCRGLGAASDALRALTTFGWTITDLHRIELFIEPWNAASIRTAERAGFQCEGLLRSHQEIAGQRRDMLLYSAIREPNRPPT